MTSTKTIAIAAALSSLVAFPVASNAGDRLTLKPLHGISFDVGSERAVAYFTSERGACNLVLTLAGEPSWNEAAAIARTRFETAIGAGKATRYVSTQGNALEFACGPDAHAMTVKPLDRVAGIHGN
jgi:hypothetical protein